MTASPELALDVPQDVLTLFEALPSSSVLMDLSGCITYWNAAAEELTGFGRDEAVGRHFADLFRMTPEERARLERLSALASGKPSSSRGRVCRTQFVGHHKAGRKLALAVSVNPLQLGGKQLLGGFVADLGCQRNLEAQLLRAQRMEIAGRLAAGIAHDFNNLLVVVLGSGDLLLQQLPSDDRRRNLVTEVLEAGRRGAALARQLLTFARPSDGEVRVIDPNRLLADAEPILRRLVGEDVRFVTTLRRAVGKLRMDPSHLEELVMNLVVNARDALTAGGTIWLETARLEVVAEVPPGSDELGRGHYVTISIRDDGVGMDEATQQRIFEAYFTTKKDRGGTGLGLATCRTIVERYGGRITLTSRPGHGSRFVVQLPAFETADDGTITDMAQQTDATSGVETIMVVEDDDAVRDVLRQALAAHGYSVVDTWSASAALEFVERSHAQVDLVLTDLVLPGVGGRELCRTLRERKPDVPTMIMSGYGPDVWERWGIQEEQIVRKPFDVGTLLTRVRTLLDARRQNDRSSAR